MHDMFGLYGAFRPKFVKVYVDLGTQIRQAVETYRSEVQAGTFPGTEQSFRKK
ncbi:MAG: 3-methyl-2-oxobutanoate hydroxymethyltransferase [Gemmataceae bacterium]